MINAMKDIWSKTSFFLDKTGNIVDNELVYLEYIKEDFVCV